MIESFWGTIKTELLYRHVWPTAIADASSTSDPCKNVQAPTGQPRPNAATAGPGRQGFLGVGSRALSPAA